MELISKILIIVLLFIIAYQDFKHRAIWWFIIPLVCLIQIYVSIVEVGFSLFSEFAIINCIVVAFQLLALYLYLRFRYRLKTISGLFHKYLGLGDVLFFFVLALAFSPVNFVLFLVLILVLSLIISAFVKTVKQSVPLAGILALGYLSVIVATIFTKINTFVDIINLLP